MFCCVCDRNFLRLGDPLCCALNDITMEELEKISALHRAAAAAASAEPTNGDTEDSETLPEGYSTPPEHPINQIDLTSGALSRLPKTAGKPLSLARIQSLVSMTTPRDGILSGFGTGACPPFVEFDMSIDGFGSLFIPSVFPQVRYHLSLSNS